MNTCWIPYTFRGDWLKRECHFHSVTVWLARLHPFNSFPPSNIERLLAGHRTAVAMVTDTNKTQQWLGQGSACLSSAMNNDPLSCWDLEWKNETDGKGCSPHCYLKYFSEREVLSAHMLKCIYFYSNLIEIRQLCGFHPLTLATGRIFQIF